MWYYYEIFLVHSRSDTDRSIPKPHPTDNCDCKDPNKIILNATYESEALEAIEFENELTNIVYIKRYDKKNIF